MVFGLDSAGIWTLDVTGATTQFSVALVATDLQGCSLVLFPPHPELTITPGVQPDVVVGLPPMHMDFIPSDPSAVGPSVLFNTSAAPDGFNATYQQGSVSRQRRQFVDQWNQLVFFWRWWRKYPVASHWERS